jgi:hypothetical protein
MDVAGSVLTDTPPARSPPCSELWACVVCPDLVLHVFSPDGARIYMDELIRVRGTSRDVQFGSWSPSSKVNR